MKIQIDKDGLLCIERVGQMKAQQCPGMPQEIVYCGDWCPLFGEPDWDNQGLHRGVDYLTICEGRVLGGDITDKRAPLPPTPGG
jgi:hypothetical protein